MEYVRVTGSTDSVVFVDGEPDGNTGNVILVSKGWHVFTLDGPADGTRPQAELNVGGTSSINPLEVPL